MNTNGRHKTPTKSNARNAAERENVAKNGSR